MLRLLYLIPIFPLAGAAINGILGRRLNRLAVSFLSCGLVALSFAVALGCLPELLNLPATERRFVQPLYIWISAGNFQARFSYLLDPLSMIMILIVTGVGLLIHIYSTGYMAEDAGYYRFFAYLNLFITAMSVLVLADNFLMMFIGWEGVGLCSYLLIGYYLGRRSAGDAAKKAFVVNRIGDFGFMVGMMLIFATFGSLDYGTVFEAVSERGVEEGWGVLGVIALLLFIGATGKSAQIPLYVWLPDAMEGPTPVSALIHAATMVTAGVYMVARSNAIYSRAPEVMGWVAVVGMVTALFAATIGLVQRDIKRVLAYSTVSQLGYMFTALGVGAFAAGIFHLMTHAFFKALLFLGAGSVIHGMGQEQDLMRMGGLKKYLPWTCATMWVATLAIAGVPGLAGFFSKDEILWRAWSSTQGSPIIWGAGVVTAGLTAFYMFRLMFLAFHGEQRFGGQGSRRSTVNGQQSTVNGQQSTVISHQASGTDPRPPTPDTRHLTPDPRHPTPDTRHPHESPWVMVGPLVVLAIFSVMGGYVMVPSWFPAGNQWLEHFLEPVFEHAAVGEAEHAGSVGLEVGLTAVSVLVALAGMGLAYLFYVARPELPARLAIRLQAVYNTLYHKYYVDEIYDAVVVNRTKDLGNFLWAFDANVVDGLVNFSAALTRFSAWFSGLFDVHIVDRLVNLVASTVQFFSMVFRKMQTGLMQRYALFILAGILLFLSLYLYIGV